MITFYDIAAQSSIKMLSANTWNTRFVLNYKELPYKTVNLTFPEIRKEFEKECIPCYGQTANGPLYTYPTIIDSNGTPVTESFDTALSYQTVYLKFPEIQKEECIPCCGQTANGPLYTCPSIIDSNGTSVTESFHIALYLDKAYPDTPKVIPPGTEALQAAFLEQSIKVVAPIYPRHLPDALHPGSSEHIRQARTKELGKPLADIEPKGEERVKAWKQVQAAFDTVDGWMSKSAGPYVMGETITFADFIIVGILFKAEISFGKDSQEWKDIATWNNGRWAALKKSLEKYANTNN